MTREAFGVSTDMLPWDIWMAGSRASFGDGLAGYRYADVVAYLQPLLDELITTGKGELDGEEPTPDDTEAKSAASSNT